MKQTTLYIIAMLCIIAAGVSSCKKVNGINNNTVIETPYSLYFADTAGTLFNSTDGKNVNNVFAPDGFPCLAICTSGPNLLYAKNSLLISTNNGKNFNHAFDSLGAYPGFACNGLPINLNQTMMIDIPEWGRTYTVVNEPWPWGNRDGLRYTLQNGVLGSWYTEPLDTDGAFGLYGPEPYSVTFTSFTMLKAGILCAYDGLHNRNGYKTQTTLWKESTGNPSGIYGFGSFNDQTGTPLPHCDVSIPDTTARYSLGHFNNRLFAIDNKGCNDTGAFYSDDTGRNWHGTNGLPGYTPILCIAAPFEEICLVGTDRAGLYVYNTNTDRFELNTNGLTKDLRVRSITFKQNIYKNNTDQRLVYIATDKGIFQSKDGGHNWILTIPGNYVAIY